jgi:hypothetical protein
MVLAQVGYPDASDGARLWRWLHDTYGSRVLWGLFPGAAVLGSPRFSEMEIASRTH